MHYIKPVRVLSLACLNILFVFGREWLRLFPPFFCVYPTPAPPLKGAGSLKGAASKGRGVAMTMTMTMKTGKPKRQKRGKVGKPNKTKRT